MQKRIYFFIILFILYLTKLCPTWALITALPANCSYTVANGWTQTISYQCTSDVNLNGAVIRFTVDNPSGLIGLNTWGFINLPSYPINPRFTIVANTVTLALNFPVNSVILPAGRTSNFSYSTNNNVRVTNFALYPSSSSATRGTLTFARSPISDPLPINTTIRVSGVDTPFTANVVFANQQILNNVPFGTYRLSATGMVNGQPALIAVTPSQLVLSANIPNITVNLTYKRQSYV